MLTPTERNYSTLDREMLVILYAIRKMRCYEENRLEERQAQLSGRKSGKVSALPIQDVEEGSPNVMVENLVENSLVIMSGKSVRM